MKTYSRVIVLLFTSVAGLVSSDSGRTQLCEGEIDLECIRNYFRQNGQCNVVETSNENLVMEDLHSYNLPQFNATFFCPYLNVGKMDAVVKEFYIDNYNDYLVWSIDFKNLTGNYPLCSIMVAEDGKEPKELKLEINTRRSAEMRIALPLRNDSKNRITNFSLKNGFYSTYIRNYLISTTAPVFPVNYGNFDTTAFEMLEEMYCTKASLAFLLYLQNYICDFGIDLNVKLPSSNDMIENSSAVTIDETDISKKCEYDTSEDISKLCEYDTSEDVTDCVRDYFEEQGTCTVVRQPFNGMFGRFLFKLANQFNPQIPGKIEEVYINTKSNNLVMTVRFEAVNVSSPNAFLIKHENGPSPQFSYIPYSIKHDVRITTMINISKGLTAEAVRNSFVTAYFLYPSGVKFGGSQDPTIVNLLNSAASDPMKVGQEMFVNQGHTAFVAYLQNNICDFGVSLENI